MATRFEVVLYGADPVALRAAGEEALDEVQRVENKLSLYRPDSEISHLNARATKEPVRVSPELFRLLEQARGLSSETAGAFDITVGPLVRAWGFMGGTGHSADPAELEAARQSVGMHLLRFDSDRCTIQFSRSGVILDLGALGKGYGIERAVEFLRESGVTSALIHGGTSTSYGIGAPPGEEFWKVAIERPLPGESASNSLLAVVPLRDAALSVSAVWGKSFQDGVGIQGHVIDPRTGRPAGQAVLAAVSVGSATESDALSTALLALGPDQLRHITALRPNLRSLVISQASPLGEQIVASNGITVHPNRS